jgi:hypothetical protein
MDNAQIIAELTRVKAEFQLRAIVATDAAPAALAAQPKEQTDD